MLQSLLCSFAAVSLAAAPPVVLKGCLAKPGALTPAVLRGLPRTRSLVKVLAPDGAYRCTLEVEGYVLRDVLDRADVKKLQADGFDRPLDTFITITGPSGRALFSYNEAFLSADGGPILADQVRMVLPHKHSPVQGPSDPTVFLGLAKREGIRFKDCASCHEGPKPPALDLPKGWLLVAPQDGFQARFVEQVASIEVHQVGVAVKANKESASKVTVETPELVGLDGTRMPLTAERYAQAPKVSWKDATFGMGRGYHGTHTWEGTDLGGLLRPLLSKGVDPRQVYVLVTAEDGYRVVMSGSEVFIAPAHRGTFLTALKNGETQGAGSGRYHTVSRGDFYIDRDVRQVKEIRIIRLP